MKETPKVSIISVIFNAGQYLEKTILSVINQDWQNIEYIIIDGGSTDNTDEIIEKYKEQINIFVSEPDNGLYDAMNKGIKKSTGDYIWFINAGDEVYSSKTLSDIQINKSVDFYYGETEIIDQSGNSKGMRRLKAPKNLTWRNFCMGMLVSHQSMIVKKELAPLFNLEYNFSSDFDWAINILKQSKQVVNTNQILSTFMTGGQTSRTIIPGLFERFRIMKKHYGLLSTLKCHFLIACRLIGQVLLLSCTVFYIQ